MAAAQRRLFGDKRGCPDAAANLFVEFLSEIAVNQTGKAGTTDGQL
jgi:hypothetical protein